MKHYNSDGSRYYTSRQSSWRAFLAGMTFKAFPRDYQEADDSSRLTRVEDAIANAEQQDGHRPDEALIDPETGRFICCGTDGLSAEPFHAVGCPNCGAVALPRSHRFAPRSWRMPNGTIIGDAYNPEAVELLKSNPDEFFRITRGILHKPFTMRAVCSCIVELTPDTVELSWETKYEVAIIAPCHLHRPVFQPTWWSRLLDKLTATNDLCYHVIIPAYGGRGVERVELGCSHSTSHHTNKVRGCSRCGCSKVFYSPMAT